MNVTSVVVALVLAFVVALVLAFVAGYLAGRKPTRQEMRTLDLYMEQLERLEEAYPDDR